MKRKKKVIPTFEVFSRRVYSVECPHCKTQLKGLDPNPDILVIRCWRCREPIELEWDKEYPTG